MKNKLIPIFLLIILACTWGSSFLLMKKGMMHSSKVPIFSSNQVGALRIFIASLFLLPLSIYFIKKINNLKTVLFLIIVGVFGNLIPAFLFTFAETKISSGYAGMLNSFTPIFTIILGVILFQQKLSRNQVVGVLIAFVGMVCLMLAGNKINGTGNFLHVFAVIIATLFYGISLNTIKHRLHHLKPLEITSLSFLLLLIPSGISVFSTDVLHTIKTNSFAYNGLFYIAILSIVGTALALMIFNQLIAMTSTLFASSVTYFIPIVATFLGLWDGEKINSYQILSMLVVLFGVIVANLKWKSI